MAQAADESKAMESEVFRAKYRKIKTVGKGSFGEAVLVRSKTDGKRYIAKAIESVQMTPKEKSDVRNEIRILAAVNHPNIVRYHEHFEHGTLIFIIMEYADGGDLNSRIKDAKKQENPEPFHPQLAMFWFLQICMALKYLHDNHILHRDLKTANIFLTSKNVVKLGDFGISTVLQNTMACAKTVCGTPYYFSPELCEGKQYNNKSDVWALGVVFYEMLTLKRPFNAKSLKELFKKVLGGQYEPIPETVPAEMRNLCASLLQLNPMQRPSINRILESTFVQESLKNFSADLEKQAERDKADYEARKPQNPPKSHPPPAPEKTVPVEVPEKLMSEKEQMAMLRGMGRANMKAMMAEQAAQQQRQPPSPQPAPKEEVAHPDVDDDGDYIAQKQAIVQQTKGIVGQKNLGGHPDVFGDDQAGSAPPMETITLANGKTYPAEQVRGILVAEMGTNLLNHSVDLVSNIMSSPNGVSNAEIQRMLTELVGPKYAHHCNAITKLAVYESKHRS